MSKELTDFIPEESRSMSVSRWRGLAAETATSQAQRKAENSEERSAAPHRRQKRPSARTF